MMLLCWQGCNERAKKRTRSLILKILFIWKGMNAKENAGKFT